MTRSQELKAKIIELFETSLDEQENDITTGIEDGIYEEESNEEYLKNIEDTRKLIQEFKNDFYLCRRWKHSRCKCN